MDWISLIPTIIQAAAAIKNIIDAANTNEDIVTQIKATVPSVVSILENISGTLFPSVKPQLKIAAGAMAAFDPNITKWLQGSLNVLLDPSPNLDVDGIYGKKTMVAVEAVQKKLGLVVDGWAGSITRSAVDYAKSQKLVIK